MIRALFLFLTPLFVLALPIAVPKGLDKRAMFSGRVSDINKKGYMIKVAVDFPNMKYLAKGDYVKVWEPMSSKNKCDAYILGKSNTHLLLKVPRMNSCRTMSFVNPGGYLWFYSEDLQTNLEEAGKLMKIMFKKRKALKLELEDERMNIEHHNDKMEIINDRYRALQAKLMSEWRESVEEIEKDKLLTRKKINLAQKSLDEIDYELEKFKIEDQNLKQKRWSLDKKDYYLK